MRKIRDDIDSKLVLQVVMDSSLYEEISRQAESRNVSMSRQARDMLAFFVTNGFRVETRVVCAEPRDTIIC
jgi:hypothetical protein